ncbi:MAG: hypothetical protein M1457_03450 [bacterium]|nr:hypothetical protein [bacterium]
MPYPQLDRHAVKMRPLAERLSKKRVERDLVRPGTPPGELAPPLRAAIGEVAHRILAARRVGRSVMLTFGAHTIKNGLAPVLIALIERGWVTHLAANGAGVIHDWELAYHGQTSEDVRANVARGEFGNWQETGFYINLALNVGAWEGLGYGEAVGMMIQTEGLTIPDPDELRAAAAGLLATDPARAAAAADLLAVIGRFGLPAGRMAIPHPHKAASAQAAACRLGVPFTAHPMFGHDIIYNHPMNCGAALGRTAERDFLAFAHSVSRLGNGVYLSVGSAVMSPMVFEKSLSISQNLAIQRGERIEGHTLVIVDLARSNWDWNQGEPPENLPDYYLRYNKTFSRMGGTMRYLTADNRVFLLALHQALAAEG